MNLDWMEQAVCAQVGGDVFFPEQGEYADKAKAMCRSCEARVACLAFALEHQERDGVYGGFTERIRLRIARQHRAGKPLEDIIAEDDAVHYARLEHSAALTEAATKRHRARERERYRAARAALNDLETAS